MLTMLKSCLLVGLDWAKPMVFLLLHVICSCIFHAYVPIFFLYLVDIDLCLVLFCFSSLSLSLSLSLSIRLVCSMALEKSKSTPSRNPFHSGASTSNSTPSHFRLSDEKGLRFLNMVISFVLHPLSHYNSITESRALFLLSPLEGLTIYFPSHFILSLIDIYKDTTTRDKLILPFVVMQILCHASVSYPESPYFSVMCAIDAATVRRSEA